VVKMGADITYILDKHYGDPEKYNEKIKDFLKTLDIDVDAENFKLVCKPTEDWGGIYINCYTEEKYDRESLKHLTYDETIFTFKLIEMPGCCAYLISTGTYVGRKYGGKGVAQFLQKLKYEMAKDSHYPYLIATTVKNNEIENHILRKFNWELVDEITNSRTKNIVLFWKKEIK